MSESKESAEGVKVLILGGIGFIGRNLVKYLVDNKLASFIRVCDKAPPAIGYLSEMHKAAFEDKSLVEFKQADLANEGHVKGRVFEGHKFTYVFNLCGETRCGCAAAEYQMKCENTAKACLAAAKENGVEKWVEVSTGQVYKSDKAPSKESAAIDPWTMVAKSRLAAETLVKESGVPHVILRTATVYGPGDLTGLTPRILCAVAYCVLEDKMKFLWGEGLLLNTVHVHDVCSAIWTTSQQAKPGSLYNLVDDSKMDQGQLCGHLAKMFDIDVGFFGTILSNAAKTMLSHAADEANDKHVPAFARACETDGILNTPLSPFIDKELLSNNHLSLDGSLITTELKFEYKYKKVTQELLEEQVKLFLAQKLFPAGFLGRQRKKK